LARVIYENELSVISKRYNLSIPVILNGTSNPESGPRAQAEAEYSHLTKFLTFRPSTPSPKASRILQSAFLGAASNLSVLSMSGVMLSSSVRVRGAEMESFIKAIPILSKAIQEDGTEFIKVLESNLKIRQAGPEDLIREMEKRVFEEEEMVQCIQWTLNKAKSTSLSKLFWERFSRVGKFTTSPICEEMNSQNRTTLFLGRITSYIDPQGPVPSDGPFPITVLPLKFSKIERFHPRIYTSTFGWSAFSVQDWVLYLSSEIFSQSPNPQYGVSFAEKVLTIVAKEWPNMSSIDQEKVVDNLSQVPCIPTQLDLQIPGKTYFRADHIFPDLPMVRLQDALNPGMECLFRRLGVRKHIDLRILFRRRMMEEGWTTFRLIRYLTGVMDELSEEEKIWLREEALFFAEEPFKSCTESQATASRTIRPTYRISCLYEPIEAMRQLQLPILDWGADPQWQTHSNEGNILFR
jgi:hypothetical protein